MAKKVVATLKTGEGKQFTRVIKMIKSAKTGAFSFEETVLPNDGIKEFFEGKTANKTIRHSQEKSCDTR